MQIPAEKHKAGRVWHTVGYPLPTSTYGGSFLYHMDNNQVALGYAEHNTATLASPIPAATCKYAACEIQPDPLSKRDLSVALVTCSLSSATLVRTEPLPFCKVTEHLPFPSMRAIREHFPFASAACFLTRTLSILATTCSSCVLSRMIGHIFGHIRSSLHVWIILPEQQQAEVLLVFISAICRQSEAYFSCLSKSATKHL